jgi:zinc/manganese transport system substrate-binding protein
VGALAAAAGILTLSYPTAPDASASTAGARAGAGSGVIIGVGAENEYADVMGQIGGRYIKVSSILSNPNTDPHSFESSPSVARLVGSAELIVQNGLGYDAFMNKMEAAGASPKRKVIDVQSLLGLAGSVPNPHLWYKPTTMPAVAKAVAADLSDLEPSHRAYFATNAARFDASLRPWYQAMARFKSRFPNTPVATTEPVGDYMLQAVGTEILTPLVLQEEIMNGVDPAPQLVTLQSSLFSQHKVKAFVYNQQVTDSLTHSFLSDAKHNGIPVVAVYETMPTPGYDYQSWMLAEVAALDKAVADKISTEKL